MVAITVTDRKEITGVMGVEVIVGTFTDAYTYTSKFSKVHAAIANSASRAGAFCSISGRVVTINCASASADVLTLVVWGQP